MGADGGIIWVKLINRKKWDYFIDNLEWRVINESAYAYKGTYANPVPEPPDYTHDWLEGAYGTDCEFNLRSLVDLVRLLLETEPLLRYGREDCKEYTFNELLEDFRTDPFVGYDLGELRLLKTALKDYHAYRDKGSESFAYLSPHFMEIKLIDWAKGIAESIDINSIFDTETWT